tara:strand:- start:14 stop:493 length:480 start_codon:yes stop_codon:yes gene_type:complete
MKKFLSTFSIIAFGIINPLSSFADCLQDFPEKYNYSGRYVEPLILKVYLKTSQKEYECKEIPYSVRKNYNYFNMKCSEDLFLKVDNTKNLNYKIRLAYKNRIYYAEAFNEKKNSQKTWFTNNEKCLADSAERELTADYKIKNYDKKFSIRIFNKAGIKS